jgi:hypothetical protein
MNLRRPETNCRAPASTASELRHFSSLRANIWCSSSARPSRVDPQLAAARIFATHEYLAGELPGGIPRSSCRPRNAGQPTANGPAHRNAYPAGRGGRWCPSLRLHRRARTERAIYLHEITGSGQSRHHPPYARVVRRIPLSAVTRQRRSL